MLVRRGATELVLQCDHCGTYFTIPADAERACPMCAGTVSETQQDIPGDDGEVV